MLSAKTYFIFATSLLAFFSVDYTSANPEAEQEHLRKFLGKPFVHKTSDDKFDELLKTFLGSDGDITKYKNAHPTITLTFADGEYTLKRDGGEIGDFTHTFKIGQPKSTEFFDQDYDVTFTQQKNTLTEEFKCENCRSTITYTFTDDELTVVYEVANIKAVQHFFVKK